MINIDTEIRHIAEDVLDDMHIDDIKYFIRENGDTNQRKKMEEML